MVIACVSQRFASILTHSTLPGRIAREPRPVAQRGYTTRACDRDCPRDGSAVEASSVAIFHAAFNVTLEKSRRIQNSARTFLNGMPLPDSILFPTTRRSSNSTPPARQGSDARDLSTYSLFFSSLTIGRLRQTRPHACLTPDRSLRRKR